MTFYETAKAAISACITAVDPNARQYDYAVRPVDTAPANMYRMFGESGGLPLNTYTFTRVLSPQLGDVKFSGHTNREVRRKETSWTIEVYKEMSQPENNTGEDSDVDTPTEYAAQIMIDAFERELFLNAAITALPTSEYKASVINVSLNEFGERYLAAETLCHYANLTVTFEHLQA